MGIRPLRILLSEQTVEIVYRRSVLVRQDLQGGARLLPAIFGQIAKFAPQYLGARQGERMMGLRQRWDDYRELPPWLAEMLNARAYWSDNQLFVRICELTADADDMFDA